MDETVDDFITLGGKSVKLDRDALTSRRVPDGKLELPPFEIRAARGVAS